MLAYGQSGRVIKHRTLFLAGRTRIHLDRVQSLRSGETTLVGSRAILAGDVLGGIRYCITKFRADATMWQSLKATSA